MRLSVSMDLDHGADNEELRVLQPLCDGTFEKQVTVIQDQEESEAAVSVQNRQDRSPSSII